MFMYGVEGAEFEVCAVSREDWGVLARAAGGETAEVGMGSFTHLTVFAVDDGFIDDVRGSFVAKFSTPDVLRSGGW